MYKSWRDINLFSKGLAENTDFVVYFVGVLLGVILPLYLIVDVLRLSPLA